MKTLQLSKALVGHQGETRTLTFREPTLGDLLAVGAEPETMVLTSGGGGWVQVSWDVVARYAALLVQEANARDSIILEQMTVSDAWALKDVITGFFSRPAGANTPSSAATSSSSVSGGTSSASKA